jgi:hypothetical protein
VDLGAAMLVDGIVASQEDRSLGDVTVEDELRQPEENDLPENSRFWLKGTHSGGHVGL